MNEIFYIDRKTKRKEQEKIYGRFFLEVLYSDRFFFRIFSSFLLPLIAKIPFFSHLYGWFQKSPLSRHKIKPFISTFQVDTSEFLEPVSSYQSFNDFFIRRLKPQARPIAEEMAILPADGRYLAFQNILQTDGYWVKGKKFSLSQLLQDENLANTYANGSLLIARLCPVDYHRFHFPCDCTPDKATLINGPLYSVNPIALKKNIEILAENKRVITALHTEHFGKVLFIDIGATYVGTIHQTFTPGKPYKKGDEKGYFSFGGSSLILLFEPNRIQFDQDLLDASAQGIELRGMMGQSLGKITGY